MNKTMKVKITKTTSPTFWYINEVGEEYDVELLHGDSYNLTKDVLELRKGNYDIPVRMILKQDCKLIN